MNPVLNQPAALSEVHALRRTWLDAGFAALDGQDYPRAAACLEEAKRLASLENNRVPTGVLRAALGWALEKLGRREEAVVESAAATIILTNHQNSTDRAVRQALARATHVAGEALFESGQRSAALMSFRQARTHYEAASGGQTGFRELVDVKERIADIHESSDQFQESIEPRRGVVDALTQLLTIEERESQLDGRSPLPTGESPDFRCAERNVAGKAKRRLKRRETYIARLAHSLARLAFACFRVGDLRSARRALDRAQQLESSLHPDVRRTLTFARDTCDGASVARELGEFGRGKDLLSMAEFAAECNESVPPVTVTEIGLVRLELSLEAGDYFRALETVSRAGSDTVATPEQRARGLIAAARGASIAGLHHEAAELLVQAQAGIRSGCPHRSDLEVTANLALALVESLQGHVERSKGRAEANLIFVQEHLGASHSLMSDAFHALAICCVAAGKLDAAGPLFESALRGIAAARRSDHPAMIPPLLGLAEFDWNRRRFCEARKRCDRALEIHSSRFVFEPAGRARILTAIGRVEHAELHLLRAEGYYATAVAAWQDHELLMQREHPEKAFPLLLLAALNAAARRLDRAGEFTSQFMPLLCRMKSTRELAAFEINRQGNLLFGVGRYGEAAYLYGLAHDIYLETLGPAHAFALQSAANRELAVSKWCDD